MDLGFAKDRILLTVAYFRNRSSNQLVSYLLPYISGFGQIAATNFPATVQNTGLEGSLQAGIITSRKFNWHVLFTITIPRNKLIAFPNLASSSYASSLVIGQPLSVQKGYIYQGVNKTTGVFQFQDINHDSVLNTQDYAVIGNTDPKIYGGFQNTFTYKGWQLDLFFDYRKQSGLNPLMAYYGENPPGTLFFNEPTELLNRWRQPGDNALVQQYSATNGTPAYNAAQSEFPVSSARLTDASFIRLKTISLGYNLPTNLLNKWHIEQSRIYLTGQNIFTITHYHGADPETQNPLALAPMRTLTAGIQVTF